MTQGTIKRSAKANTNKSQKGQKKGSVAKKQNKTTADKIQKKYSAGLVAKTEKLLGERAGHLELIGKGKKAEKTDDKKKQKGGTRRFG